LVFQKSLTIHTLTPSIKHASGTTT
jgi:hypothetical protein